MSVPAMSIALVSAHGAVGSEKAARFVAAATEPSHFQFTGN